MAKVKKDQLKKKQSKTQDHDNKSKQSAKTVQKKSPKSEVKDKPRDKKDKNEKKEKKESSKVLQKKDKIDKGSQKEKAGDKKGKKAERSHVTKKEKSDKDRKGKKEMSKSEQKPTEKSDIKKAKTEVTRQPALRPPERRVSVKSAQVVPYDPKSAPASMSSLRTPSPKRPCVSPSETSSTSIPESLVALRKEALEKGVTLEAYMEELSRQELEKNVEDHMNSLIKEHAEKTKDPENEDDEEGDQDMDQELVEEVEPLSSDSSSTTSEADSDSDQAESAAPETEADQQEDGDMEEEDEGSNGDCQEEEEDEEEDEEDEATKVLDREIDALMNEEAKPASPVETNTALALKDGQDKEDTQTKQGQQDNLRTAVAAQGAAQVEKYGEFANANSTLFGFDTKDFL